MGVLHGSIEQPSVSSFHFPIQSAGEFCGCVHQKWKDSGGEIFQPREWARFRRHSLNDTVSYLPFSQYRFWSSFDTADISSNFKMPETHGHCTDFPTASLRSRSGDGCHSERTAAQ